MERDDLQDVLLELIGGAPEFTGISGVDPYCEGSCIGVLVRTSDGTEFTVTIS